MLSRYFGRAFVKSTACTDTVANTAPISAKAIATVLRIAKPGCNPNRSSRFTAGVSKKLIRIARTIGNKKSFAQDKAQKLTTRYAKPVSFPNSSTFPDFLLSGIKLSLTSFWDGADHFAPRFVPCYRFRTLHKTRTIKRGKTLIQRVIFAG